MKRKILIYIISASSIIIVGILIYRYAFLQGYLRMNYPTLTEYPVQGIDVSHHQGHIQWHKLDTANVQFAFIKATEGADHKDSLFLENWQMAESNNIMVGAYHFFSFCKSGEEQAANYIETVPVDSLSMPPIVDVEYGGNCKIENRKEDIIHEITEYVDIVEKHYHKRVIIYSTNEFYKNNLIYRFPYNPIWIRDILKKPQLPDLREWTFWQFTNRGRLDGVRTMVDLNAFNGDKAMFEKFVDKTIFDL